MSCVNITKESLAHGFYAGHGTIGSTEGKISSVSIPIMKHIVIRSDSDNQAPLYVGRKGHALSGFLLRPGNETPPIFVDDTDKIGIVADDLAQVFSYIIN